MLNCTNPKTDPWGTPLITDVHLDIELLTTILFQPIPYPLNSPPLKLLSFQFREKNGELCQRPQTSPGRWRQLPFCCSPMPSLHYRRPPGWSGMTFPWWTCAVCQLDMSWVGDIWESCLPVYTEAKNSFSTLAYSISVVASPPFSFTKGGMHSLSCLFWPMYV